MERFRSIQELLSLNNEWVMFALAVIVLTAVFMLLLPGRRFRAWRHLKQDQPSLVKKLSIRHFRFVDYRAYEEEARRIEWNQSLFLPFYGVIALGASIGIIFSSIITAVIGALSGAWVMWIILQNKKIKYIQKIEQQVEQMIQTVSMVYSLNQNLLDALERAALEAGEPIKSLLLKLISEYQSGKPFRECIDEMQEKVPVRGFKFFSNILVTVDSTGGDVDKIMRSAAQIVNKNRFLNAELRSELTSVRQEHKINLAIGIFILLFFRFGQPEHFSILTDHLIGQVLIGGMLLYMVWSIYAVSKLTTP
ncbi:type II secretion system F family protein [Caldalkalibacillus mannanilyticus]|uniref:type II secretion system F family protein n=1 Tax=Caldalkalibacillus mannanilyticus TaxID=1418 RepID=UPI00046AE671|nr:type II secretion system F family protein [Caldalkalibacillus mannanilyticus]